jgi:hypothetical protein
MTLAEALKTTCRHCVAGLASARTAVVTTLPCRAPHHPLSDAGLLSGGHVPMPAEVSLAHHRVRFLDELPECRRHVLAVLRQPLVETVVSMQSPERPRPQALRRWSATGAAREDAGQAQVPSTREDVTGVDMDPLVGAEAGQPHGVAGQPTLDPAAPLPSQARQQPMWPPQALRVSSAAPRDEVGPLQAGLHPGVMRLDPLCLPPLFLAVPYVHIAGLLPITPQALFDHGHGAMPWTGPPRAAVEPIVHGLGTASLVFSGTACALSPSGSRRHGASAVRPWP